MKILNLPEITIPILNCNKRLKIFYVADTPNWSFHYKGLDYKNFLPQFDIDIGFANQNWMEQANLNKYDVVLHLHEQYIKETNDLKIFINEQNFKGTKVLLTINEVICPYDLMMKKQKLSLYNSISVNNPYVLNSMNRLGFKNIQLTYDGVNLDMFRVIKEFNKRKFNVFFSSSMMRLSHKGYDVLKEVKDILKNHRDIRFVEIYSDSYNNKRTWNEMIEIYNSCKLFLCLSKSEGGPCTLLESAACGCVPICTDVGYSNYFKSCSIIERNAQKCADKILELKENESLLNEKHEMILEEIKKWNSKFMSQQWGNFWQQSYFN